MSLFKKGEMRKQWIASRDKAKNTIATMKVPDEKIRKSELLVIENLGKAFGPHLDKVEDMLPKKADKAKDYKAAWDTAHKQCLEYIDKLNKSGFSLNSSSQTELLNCLRSIKETLNGTDYKPAG